MTKNKHTKSNWRMCSLLLIPVFVFLMIISVAELIRPSVEQNDFNELSAMVFASRQTKTEHSCPIEVPVEKTQLEITGDAHPMIEPVTIQTEKPILAQYAPIYELNADLFGWICIDGTVVDYPVMHSPDEPERYLRKNLSGEYSVSGVPFMEADCYENCGNYILYGHNMKNGSMFKTIVSYADSAFWKDHPTICFDTLYQTGEYKVFAAFYSKAYYAEDEGVFRVYDYTDLGDEEIFNEFVSQVERASLYDTGIEAEYGDTFITLITCSYHTENGRFVVIAVREKEY